MSENFAQLLEQSFSESKLEKGSIIVAEVVQIDPDAVIVNAGTKSEGLIPVEQFYNDNGELEVTIGDTIEVALESLEDGFGTTVLSRERAKLLAHWAGLESAYEKGESITGVITDKVKGGFTVMIGDIRAFLPGSLVDVRPVRDSTHLEGRELEFKCIKIDKKRNNVVVSRRAIVEEEYSEERRKLLDTLEEGQIVKGIVKNLTDYGAFVDLGGIDGLLHITDMAWRRVKHPSEMVAIGDEIDVVVLKFDREKNRVSLGMKQTDKDPWEEITLTYPIGSKHKGRVTNLADYGCFVEIAEGIEGLVHMSEMDWTNKNVHPANIVQIGDEVEVMILDVDVERRRISMGMKQCLPNPWDEFAVNHHPNDRVSGVIKAITDFGVFVELEGGVDGLVHLSDISWDIPGEDAIRNYKKGDTIEAVLLLVDIDRERISLGIKQLTDDPFASYMNSHEKGSIVTGTLQSVDSKGAVVALADQVEGYLKAKEISRDRSVDPTDVLNVGDDVEALIMSVDGKSRSIQLSITAKEAHEDKQAREQYSSSASTGTTSLGDLLKQQMDKQDSQ